MWRTVAVGAVVAVTSSCIAGSSSDAPESVAPELVATTSSAVTLSGLFATGVDGAGKPIAIGATDPHYVLASTYTAITAPIAVTPNAAWVASATTANWISLKADTNGADNGVYTYSTTFTLLGLNPASATMSGTWACDDSCVLFLNGTRVAQRGASAYGSLTAFNVPAGSPFVVGPNTLSVVVTNSGNGPTGVQIATISGAANGCNADVQCAANQFCDTQASACTPTLPNSARIPTISGHTPALNGMCGAGVGPIVCQSTVCDTDGKCGLADESSGCSLATQGLCRSGQCSTNGKCEPMGGCNVDSDCTGTNFCLESTHTCTAQLPNLAIIPSDPGHTPTLNAMCTPAAAMLVCQSGVCDTDGKCGYADGDGTCTSLLGGAAVCRSGTCSLLGVCRPASGCLDDTDCAAGNWCAEATHTCMPKLTNGSTLPVDAPHANPTLDGNCTTAAATLVCQSSLCLQSSKTCVQCTPDNENACAGTTPSCTAAGTCAACDGDYGTVATAVCPTTTFPFCTVTGACGKCLTRLDCATGTRAGPVCDFLTGACVPSSADGGVGSLDAGATDAGGMRDGGDGGGDASTDGSSGASSDDASSGGDAGDASQDGSEADASDGDATTTRDSGGAGSSGDTTPTGSELGGGGFSCTVSGPGASPGSHAAVWVLMIGMGASGTRARRRRKQ